MGHSIQDYLKKINSRLSLLDAISVAVTAIFLVAASISFSWISREKQQPALYLRAGISAEAPEADIRPFGSRNGTTYTFSWCQGGERIQPENKIYYLTKEEAEMAGRRLSKLCAK
jgi:hypothetical protein